MLSSTIRKELSYPGRIPSDEFVALKIAQLRKLLLDWRGGRLETSKMLELADEILEGNGIEEIRFASGNPAAAYVNTGETYEPTIVFDRRRNRVWATSWGAWVEAEENLGRRFG